MTALAFERLEESLNRMNQVHADALRDAVRDFNASPISVSAVDTLRERVLRIADNLGRPLVTGDVFSRRVPS